MRTRILMIFLDGVGIGKKDPHANPFYTVKMETFRELAGGSVPHLRDARRMTSNSSLVPVNATLGIPGLPQSGTGQTALLTGLNAPHLVGKHFGPYPYSTLKPIIQTSNIFQRLRSLGKRVFYANAFPRQFLEYVASNPGRSRIAATTMSWLSSGYELNTSTALEKGKALSSDITNERWPLLGYPDMPVITPQQAGKRLAELARRYDFVLYEYYFTDHAGHSQSMQQATEVLTKLDGLLEGILDVYDYHSSLLVVTSDHGNIEDLSVKTHTRNPVPLLAVGASHRKISTNVKDLTDVVPAILRIMD